MKNGRVSDHAVDGENGQIWTKELKSDEFDLAEAKVLKMVKNVFADYFAVDEYEGMIARLESGNLGLNKVKFDSKGETEQPVTVAATAKVSA